MFEVRYSKVNFFFTVIPRFLFHFLFINRMEAPSNCSRNGTSIIDESLLSLEIDRERIMNLKQRVDFVEMLSDEISITIDNFRKQSFLSYILAATCPSSENRTEEIRTKELRSIICSSRAEYQAILRQALTKLKRVKNECAIIAKEKENIFLQLSVKKSAEMDIYRLNEYLIIFESIFKSAKENYDKVTSEYLILRHNGRVLQDLLDERFKETEASFLESSQALEQYESEATVKVCFSTFVYYNYSYY